MTTTEEQELMAKIGNLAGKINRHKAQQHGPSFGKYILSYLLQVGIISSRKPTLELTMQTRNILPEHHHPTIDLHRTLLRAIADLRATDIATRLWFSTDSPVLLNLQMSALLPTRTQLVLRGSRKPIATCN